MNKEQMVLLDDVRRLIEERNALQADKQALIEALGKTVNNCEHCAHENMQPCNANIDCVCCTVRKDCPCAECKEGSHFEWRGRGKHAARTDD